ncbi:succinate dehydrogenase assembly factor 2 [Candidatus Methylomicrobium oryzae]|jgi:antitoxin CptB|uniref:FAD assembly factor SdhE n=1 Tax=Candidatus Methylomicrobium oryzae TaxID=2802053 RepID=UPI001924F363|nr:succinate dehydrogenase assembly factor 2 [Methylomicrobium sp. RS1]MBL1264198.1 succinate dehydrogenase assembly factor 2 [Methylomicrobium sp. RS1]
MRSFEKLKWRCRRGVVELDILLLHYLETHYLLADEDEQNRFADLLEWEDDELLAVLVGGKKSVVSGFAALVGKIRNVTGIS